MLFPVNCMWHGQVSEVKKVYSMPIRLEIDSRNPDLDAKRTAEAIYDAVEHYATKVFHGKEYDMEYSIYILAEKEVFEALEDMGSR